MRVPKYIELEELNRLRARGGRFLSWGRRERFVSPGLVYPKHERRREKAPTLAFRAWDLGIDFGTSAIVVALIPRSKPAELQPLRFQRQGSDSVLLPAELALRKDLGSANLSANLLFPYSVSHAASKHPDAVWKYYPYLKRRIELQARKGVGGDWQRRGVLEVAALCHRTFSLARDPQGRSLTQLLASDFEVYLTVPNAFPREAVGVLEEGVRCGAASALGRTTLPKTVSLLEAEAVAYGEVDRLRPLRQQEDEDEIRVLVLDAGAGTTDASIVTLEDDVLKVVAHAGLPVGGMDIDAMLASGGTDQFKMTTGRLPSVLRELRDKKEQYLSRSVGGESLSGEEAVLKALNTAAEKLIASLPGTSPLRSANDAENAKTVARVVTGLRRYLELSVAVLLRCLPAEELRGVTSVVVSGRSSLLLGFEAMTRLTLEQLEVEHDELRTEAAPDDRKLAVLRGAASFASGTQNYKPDRKPNRAGFDLWLEYGVNREAKLLPAGRMLVDGWGVACWNHEELKDPELHVRPRVAMRTISEAALDYLRSRLESGNAPLDVSNIAALRGWSTTVLASVDRPTPFCAQVAYDFFQRRVIVDVDGQRNSSDDSGDDVSYSGGRHPVHGMPEQWFELALEQNP